MRDTENFKKITSSEKYLRTKKYVQHGDFTVYDHSVYVCSTCFKLAKKLHLKIDRESLAKAALLHDYFLYDWHDKNHPRLHGFRHAKIAAENAKRDFGLTEKEYKIIRSHMFPMGTKIPSSKEALILCLADKYCATRETVKGHLPKKSANK